MRDVLSNTGNLLRLGQTYEELEANRASGMRVMLISGYTGYGKTVGVRRLVDERKLYYVEASATWSCLTMLQDIIREVGQDYAGVTSARGLERMIEDVLKITQRGIVLDEFDRVLNAPSGKRQGMIEVLRSIHDRTGIPLILVGEEKAETKLARHTQFNRRCSFRLQFEPLADEDAIDLALSCCEVQVEEALMLKLNKACQGNTAYVCMNLAQLERIAKGAGEHSISLQQFEGSGARLLLPGFRGGK